jgi:hypothetical protein
MSSKVSPSKGVIAQSAPSPAPLVQSYQEIENEHLLLPVKAIFVVTLKLNLRHLPLPLPHRGYEMSCSHSANRENYYRQGPNNQKLDTKSTLKKKTNSFRQG